MKELQTFENDEMNNSFYMSKNFYLKAAQERNSNSANRREAKGRTLDEEVIDSIKKGRKPVLDGTDFVHFKSPEQTHSPPNIQPSNSNIPIRTK